MEKSYISATRENGKNFISRQISGPVVMLNLLRFREQADYADSPELASEAPISGEEAYRLYIQHVTPLLNKIGSEVLFFGKGGHNLIGPEEEYWDQVILVRHPGVQSFLAFAEDEAYKKIAGHRTAALADSRLLPVVER